ncbi:ketoreductase [Herbihabitans rhizosphaerae]|uniref:Ketoreductase n=1 Tax=Herbihabitans rhizosphaerae TaxID=1872711 RepID=A0A4Q7KCH8_9PSEU|nr:SDR family NAD(P)-dependent oxidoreductase [Herbihabitans rhizosphaerae]RZS31179.1 ketoreductase [Herbihabitans rhizosphaerae]
MSAVLRDKVALITGGSRGIGRASATTLGTMGATVVITGTSTETVDTGVAALKDAGLPKVSGHVADVREQSSVDALFDDVLAEHGRVDVLVNNAGVGGGGWTHEIPYDTWEQLIDINLNGVFRVTRTWLLRSGARDRGWGRVINIASTGGKQGVRLAVAYTASKHGVVGLSKSLAHETAKHGITVNAVCPGFVETELSIGSRQRYAAAWGITPEEVLEKQNARFPLGRHVNPDEVARLVGFLADPAAEAITGQAMNVCGGLGLY